MIFFRDKSTTKTTTTSPITTKSTINNDFEKPSESGLYLPKSFEEDSINGGICGLSLKFGYIVGGNVAKFGELPFVAILGYYDPINDKIEHRCGGTLINR